MRQVSMTVAEAMTHHAVRLRPDDHVFQARQVMQRCGFRHLPVVEDGELVGIVSDRDLLASGLATDSMQLVGQRQIRDVMTSGVVTCHRDDRIGDAIDTMLRLRIDALIVTGAAHAVLGILTSTDILAALRRLEGVIDVKAMLKSSDDADTASATAQVVD